MRNQNDDTYGECCSCGNDNNTTTPKINSSFYKQSPCLSGFGYVRVVKDFEIFTDIMDDHLYETWLDVSFHLIRTCMCCKVYLILR